MVSGTSDREISRALTGEPAKHLSRRPRSRASATGVGAWSVLLPGVVTWAFSAVVPVALAMLYVSWSDQRRTHSGEYFT
ncbi:hypothetical protein ACFP63_12920 [Oerskovia jenensis]|uniref:Uncharacterized protein n=2 Tax=Oerskovia jenensis TaxID=162169 RepID=A0ABS2LAP5_9CELL|nr:hypothetical protein [Oerskovia jenensis]MBM7477475.1 hypothetical protein [Oerskovia jenensis]